MHLIGIDVSKQKLAIALYREHRPESPLSKSFRNTPAGWNALIEWCCHKAVSPPDQLHLVMEATGPYHEQVALFSYQAGCQVSIVNPALIKGFAQSEGLRHKTDPLDAKLIGRFGLEKELRRWSPPPVEYQHLTALLTRLEQVKLDLQREKNRLEKLQAGAGSTSAQASIEESIQFLKQQQKQLEQQIRKHIDQHPILKQDQQLLESIPAIGPEIGSWMNNLLQHQRFQRAREASAYVGVTPKKQQSGTSVNPPDRMSKVGPTIYRQKLYMAALVGIQYNDDLKALYQRLLKKGKKKKVALGAVMRKIVHICFGVIKHQTEFKSQTQAQT